MFDCTDVAAALEDEPADPRLDPDTVRCLPATADGGPVVLVGVVHDHPASVYRVRRLLRELEPAVLALELPPLAVPLFERYADDAHTPPRLGGEMSVAIQAAGDARTVGIDAPDGPYLRMLVSRARSGDVPREVVRTVARDTARGVAHTLACRVGAVVSRLTGVSPVLYTHIRYPTTLLDAPADQAAHEAAHLDRQRAFLGVVEPPPATALVDETREARMAERLRALRADGGVVAVVGMNHLDPIRDRLREGARADSDR